MSWNTPIFIQENAFETICKKSVILCSLNVQTHLIVTAYGTMEFGQ